MAPASPHRGRGRFAFVASTLAFAACGPRLSTYSGTVQTESIAVGSQVGGRIAAVDVATGGRVARGEILIRLDPTMLRAQLAQNLAQQQQAEQHLAELEHGNIPSDVARARAQDAQAAAQYAQTVAAAAPQTSAQAATVRDAEEGVRTAQAAVRDAAAAVRLAMVTLRRTRSLAATGDFSRQSLDQARADEAQALARYAQARHQESQASARLAQARATYLALTGATLPGERAAAQANAAAQAANYETVRGGARTEEIAQARAQFEAARAAADYARVRLEESTVRAPADGVVESLNLHPGDLLAAGQQAAIIDTFADPYVYIYASQRDLGRLPNGQRLRAVSDAGGAAYDAVVETHDRSAQFTPQSTQTADERAELVYGVKVRIYDPDHRLLDGTTVSVQLP